MNVAGWLGRLVVLIAIATVVTGAVQMVSPAFVLGIVGVEAGAASRHFFGIVGMFMVLFGGLALHGVRAQSAPALLWASLQKFGAVAAVVLGVTHGIFATIALGVAGFDLVSGVIMMLYWRYVAAGRH